MLKYTHPHAADRTAASTGAGGAITRAGGAKLNTVNSLRDERACVYYRGRGGADVKKKQFWGGLDKCHRRHNEGRFVQVLAAASRRMQCASSADTISVGALAHPLD